MVVPTATLACLATWPKRRCEPVKASQTQSGTLTQPDSGQFTEDLEPMYMTLEPSGGPGLSREIVQHKLRTCLKSAASGANARHMFEPPRSAPACCQRLSV
jgi:hypothetical protein